jgi:hypothetical protein
MKPYVNEELELSQETIDLITKKAESLNMTFNELVNKILELNISEKISFAELKTFSEERISGFFIITDDDGNPIAQIRPIED